MRRVICSWQVFSLLVRSAGRRLHLVDVPRPENGRIAREISTSVHRTIHSDSRRPPRVPYQITIVRTHDSMRFLANRYSADCGIGVKCAPTELCVPLTH
jgi:hypothetical protein